MLFLLLAAGSSLIACGLYARFAHRTGIYAHPNERSAHSQPTPSGGGVGIYIGFSLACALVALILGNWSAEFWGLMLLTGMLVALGYLDDIYGLSSVLRLIAYSLMCVLAVASLSLPWWLVVPATVYALWLMNLFNFMDGIDVLAGSETVVVASAAGLLSLWWVGPTQYALFSLLLAASVAGFLVWNWPPARLFMGDAGSVSIGFMLACLSLLGEVEGALPLASWLILMAVFVTDASVTLLWRMASGQAFTQAHSLHLYQRLSRYWRSHLRVNGLALIINLAWLVPLAAVSVAAVDYRWVVVVIAYLPLVIAALLSLTGRLSSA